jgi:adenine-specific DNA-methyltransferase
MVTQAGFTDIEMVMRISLTLDRWKVIMVVEWDPEKYCHSGVDSALGLKKLIPRGARPKLILTDPPYNLGFDYGDVNDSMKIEDYHKMLLKVFDSAYEAADENSHLFIINYPEIISRMWDDVIEPKTKSGANRKKHYWKFHQWITWCYPNNWPPQKNRFTRASRAIIWMTKGKPKTELKRIVQPYRNPWDRRVKGLMEEGKRGPAFYDWWDRIDLCKNVSEDKSKEPPYSNQMPELLLKRIIHITTSPGDVVADPFAGTFSTVKAAIDLGRLGWGCDLNKKTQIYHPNKQGFNSYSEEIFETVANNQWFDLDWKSEPFDLSRAGVDTGNFLQSIAAGLGSFPPKQRILMLREVYRLQQYSSTWNIGQVFATQDESDNTPLNQIVSKVPITVMKEILSDNEVGFSESDNATKLTSKLTNLLSGKPEEVNISKSGQSKLEEWDS